MKPAAGTPARTPARLRSLLELLAAAVAGWALAAACGDGDAFRGTLAAAPLAAAALRAVERHAGARVTRRLDGRIAALVFGALIVATLQRQRLGLVAAVDWFLAAGLLLLLAHRAGRLLVGLRPLLGRRLPRRPPAAFFLLPLVVYLAIQPWSSAHRQPDGDEPFYLLLAHSLAYDLDVDLTNNYAGEDWRRFMVRPIEPQPGDPVGPGGERYSRHDFLLPLALAPAYRLAGRHGAMAVMAVLAAALAWMVLRLARHYAPARPGPALLAYGIFAFSPPLLLYSYQIWVEVPAALLLTLALDRLLALRREPGDAGPWSARGVAGFALPVVLLPILKLRLGLLAAPLLLLAAWRARPGRRAIVGLAAALTAAAASLLAINAVRFGNPLRIYSWSELDVSRYAPGDFVRGAVGMFYDCAFGLFPAAPIWLLLLPALGLAARRREPLLVDLAAVALPYLGFIAPRIEWFGGWSPPFRYPLAVLPLLALVLVPLLAERRRPWLGAAIAALAAATLVLTTVWVVIPGWTYNFADGRSLLLDEAGVRLGADVARFFPSTVRPRPATWLWLAGSLALVPAGWLLAQRRRRRAGRSPALGGVVAALLALALLVAASRRVPTRIVHFEDGYVVKQRGEVYPPPWVLQRPTFTGGWTARVGGRLSAPVVRGGERVEILLHARKYTPGRPSRLWIGAGETRLAAPAMTAEWREHTLGPFDWPAGEPLVVRALRGPVIVDRAELRWR